MRRKRRTGGGEEEGERERDRKREASIAQSVAAIKYPSYPPPIPTSYFLYLFRYKVLVTMQDDKNLDLHLGKCVVLSFLLTNSS